MVFPLEMGQVHKELSRLCGLSHSEWVEHGILKAQSEIHECV